MSLTTPLGKVASACALALFGLDTQGVQAVSIEDMLGSSYSANSFAQADAQLSTEMLIDGMLEAAQDGLIRIPIKKQETGFMSQLYADADNGQVINGATQLTQTYDLNDPEQLQTAINLGQLQNVQIKEPLTNSQNLSYIGELYVGSGTPQKVRAIFDTGSANPWILSQEGTKTMKPGLEIHPFDPKKSPSFKEPAKDKKHWVRISFGSGKIRGYFVQDQVLMGSPSDTSNQLVVPDWTFGMVVDHSVFNGKFDALIGMAYPQFAERGVTPLFDGLMQSKQLAKNVFSWYLSYNPDEESEILLGGWDTNRFTGKIAWHDVKHKLFWSLQLDDVLVGDEVNGYQSTGYCKQPGVNCLVCPDSGTSLATFPQGHFNKFQAEYGDVVSCEEGDELAFPDLVYVIVDDQGNKVPYKMPSHHWVTRKIDTKDPKGGKCGNIIKPLGVNQVGLENLHILGDVFMQLYYTIHDRDNDRVGFATAVHRQPEVLVQFDTSGILASVRTVEHNAHLP